VSARVVVLLAAVLATATPLAAQEATQQLPPQERVSLRIPLAVYASSAALDLYTTHDALQREGFYERNPMGAWLDDRPTTLVVASAAADTAIVWSLHRWLAPRHPRLLRAGLYGAAAVRFLLAARNARAVRAHDWRVEGRP
jgi:hypothetical protein